MVGHEKAAINTGIYLCWQWTEVTQVRGRESEGIVISIKIV